MKRNQGSFRGCLLGGAVGDALGVPVEFLLYDEIIAKFGNDGIMDLLCNRYSKAEISDDTQMTLFTAEGILRSETAYHKKGISDPALSVYYSYLRWLATQGFPRLKEYEQIYDGWLINTKELHHRRAPGNTCLSSLESGIRGTVNNPINNSKGCGGVMRVAPAGLFYPKDKAFKMGMDFAAITHGHPSGYLSAGAIAYMISSIISGVQIDAAAADTVFELKNHENSRECCNLLEKAIDLSKSNVADKNAISDIGEGWVGDEALAISVYCALKYQDDFMKAVIAAVNHDGDSDSTGAITGNILGAYLGVDKIPGEWIEKIELRDEITAISDDLLVGFKEEKQWVDKYPV